MKAPDKLYVDNEAEMTRKEQIEKAAKRYIKDIVTPLPASLMTAFVKGAEYADEHPINYDGKAMLHVLHKGAAIGRREMLDKACEFLKSYRQETPDGMGYIAGIINDETIEDFRKYMEEQQ